jgi:hypothetical protein
MEEWPETEPHSGVCAAYLDCAPERHEQLSIIGGDCTMEAVAGSGSASARRMREIQRYVVGWPWLFGAGAEAEADRGRAGAVGDASVSVANSGYGLRRNRREKLARLYIWTASLN